MPKILIGSQIISGVSADYSNFDQLLLKYSTLN